jgi:hypothetical protein
MGFDPGNVSNRNQAQEALTTHKLDGNVSNRNQAQEALTTHFLDGI